MNFSFTRERSTHIFSTPNIIMKVENKALIRFVQIHLNKNKTSLQPQIFHLRKLFQDHYIHDTGIQGYLRDCEIAFPKLFQENYLSTTKITVSFIYIYISFQTLLICFFFPKKSTLISQFLYCRPFLYIFQISGIKQNFLYYLSDKLFQY